MIVGPDPVEAAKVLQKFRADLANQKRPEPKAGVMGNQILSSAEIERLATIPARPVLYGQVVGALAAPLTGLVGTMSRALGSVVQVLKAAADKKAAQAA
jgi:large subunit ribosomal protein L10